MLGSSTTSKILFDLVFLLFLMQSKKGPSALYFWAELEFRVLIAFSYAGSGPLREVKSVSTIQSNPKLSLKNF